MKHFTGTFHWAQTSYSESEELIVFLQHSIRNNSPRVWNSQFCYYYDISSKNMIMLHILYFSVMELQDRIQRSIYIPILSIWNAVWIPRWGALLIPVELEWLITLMWWWLIVWYYYIIYAYMFRIDSTYICDL